MKIDLHVHIKGEGKRVIEKEKMLLKLQAAGVEFVSVTEHNLFDRNVHEFLIEKGIVSIPGIEVSVEDNSKHILLYCEDIKEIKEFESEKGISKKDFIDKLNNVKSTILVSPHFMKDWKRSFQDHKEVDDFFKDISNNSNIKFMLEFPSKSKIKDYYGNATYSHHVSSFSDIDDWDRYEKIVLPEIGFNIKTLEEYIHYFVLSNENAFEFSAPLPTEFEFFHGKTKKQERIKLFKGLNIIFGAKGSGKTELINSISNSKNNFKIMAFSSFGDIKGLDKLYKEYLQKDMIDNFVKKNLEESADLLNQTISYEPEELQGLISPKTFSENLEAYNKVGIVKDLQKKIYFLNEIISNDSQTIKDNYEYMVKIYKKIDDLINEIDNNKYKGTIKKKDFKEIIEKIHEDLKGTLILDNFSLKTKFAKKTTDLYKIIDKPSLGLSKRAESIFRNVKLYSEKHNVILKNYQETEKIYKNSNGLIFKSDILGDEYKFSYEIKERKGKKDSSDDYSLVEKNTDGMDYFENFQDIWEKKDIIKIIKIKKTNSDIPVSLSSKYNIFFESKFKEDKLYIPSTGQLDMLLLDKRLTMDNDNILIDEFCNSFDNDFVYKTIVPMMNKENKIILATTHNSIISVIPKIQKYIYMKNFVRYESDHSYFGCLKSGEEEIPTKQQIIKTIEGTKNAFNERKIIYGNE